jgi:hypothetical protein
MLTAAVEKAEVGCEPRLDKVVRYPVSFAPFESAIKDTKARSADSGVYQIRCQVPREVQLAATSW